jgi:hypothetical protein
MPVKFYNGSETKTLLTPLKKAFNENNFLVVGIKDKPDIIISPLVKQVDLTKAYSKLERLDVTIRLDLGFANSKKAGIYEEKMLSKIIQSEADKQEKAREIILQGFEITGQKLKKRLFTKINKTSKRQKEINELIKKYKTKNEKGKKEKKNKPVPLYDLTKPNSVKSYSN